MPGGGPIPEPLRDLAGGVRLPSPVNMANMGRDVAGNQFDNAFAMVDRVRTTSGSIIQKTGDQFSKLQKMFNQPFEMPKLPFTFKHLRVKRQSPTDSGSGVKGGASGTVEGHGSHKWDESTGKVDVKENENSDRTGERMFDDVSTSKSLVESFKSTSGITDKMSSSDFAQYSESFSKKETVDIKVSNIQKGSKVIISQVMFECDGNVIKLPKIYIHNGQEELPGITQSSMRNKVQTMTDQRNQIDDFKKKNNTATKGSTTPAPPKTDVPKEKKVKETFKALAQKESVIGRLLNDEHSLNNSTDWVNIQRNLTTVADIDPSLLMHEDDEEDD